MNIDYLEQLKKELTFERDTIKKEGNLTRLLRYKYQFQIELLDELINDEKELTK